MAAKRKELAEAVLLLLERDKDSRAAAQAVASYLIAERRTKELNSLLRDLEELRFRRGGILEVTATAARPLSAEAKDKLRNLFEEAKTVIANEEINQEILGGVKVRALDKVADFSVQARLRQLRRGVTS